MNSKQCMIKQAIVSELSGTYGRPNPELPKLDIFDKESCENMTNYIPRFKAGKEDQAHIQKIIDEWRDKHSRSNYGWEYDWSHNHYLCLYHVLVYHNSNAR